MRLPNRYPPRTASHQVDSARRQPGVKVSYFLFYSSSKKPSSLCVLMLTGLQIFQEGKAELPNDRNDAGISEICQGHEEAERESRPRWTENKNVELSTDSILQDIIPRSNNFLKQFLDLLRRIFIYDPAKRITAKEALLHPWFREVALQDDGTVAAKIRQERAAAAS